MHLTTKSWGYGGRLIREAGVESKKISRGQVKGENLSR